MKYFIYLLYILQKDLLQLWDTIINYFKAVGLLNMSKDYTIHQFKLQDSEYVRLYYHNLNDVSGCGFFKI